MCPSKAGVNVRMVSGSMAVPEIGGLLKVSKAESVIIMSGSRAAGMLEKSLGS